MKAKFYLSLLAAVLFAGSCSNDNGDAPVVEPEVTMQGDLELKPTTLDVLNEGSQYTMQLTSNVSWTMATDAEWITVTPSSKEIKDAKADTTVVTITVAENKVTKPREAVVILSYGNKDIPYTFSQGAADQPVLTLFAEDGETELPAKVQVEADATELTIVAVGNVAWEATTTEEWVDLTAFQNPSADKSLTSSIYFEANTEENAREAVIIVTPAAESGLEPISFTLQQKGNAKIDIFSVDYEALFGYSGKYYYWSKKTEFKEDELWNDGDTDFNAYLAGFASQWFEGKAYTIPCFWDEAKETMRIGTYYTCGEYTATAEDAEQFAAQGVKEGDKLELMTYSTNTTSEEYLVDFKLVQFNDGTIGFNEVTAGELQIVVVFGNKLLAYMPARVALTAFQEIAASSRRNAPKANMNFGSTRPISFDKAIKLDHKIKTLKR